MPRTLIRGRNPEGVGRGKTTRRWKKPTRHPIFILLCGLRRAMVIPAVKSMPRTPIRGGNPREGRPAHPCHIESLWAVPPQPTVLVRSQFANAQDKLRSNLNSYSTTIPPSGACLFDSTCPGYGNGWPVVVSTSRARLSASDRYADSISARFKRASEAPTGGGFRSIRLRKHDSK